MGGRLSRVGEGTQYLGTLTVYPALVANWWDDFPEQRYWMEHVSPSARSDLGAELFAPRSGRWVHELLRFVQPGDVIMHWRGGAGFVGSSIASSVPRVEPRAWDGREQECWVVDLSEYEDLPQQVSLSDVRAVEPQLRRTKQVLTEAYQGFKYFPFDFSDKRELRAHQGYLSKLPLEVFEVLALAGLDAPVLFDPTSGQQASRLALAPRGPRYLTDTELRIGVERYAVRVVRSWYSERGASGVVELGKPYDLELTWNRTVRHIEVKGSTMVGVDTVLLTRNEVTHARRYQATDLVVVDSIEFSRPANEYTFSGGRLRRWEDWAPNDSDLSGLQYQYSLPTL